MKIPNVDEQFMKRALMLAQRGRGCVSPNPMVGCVIVKNGKIISSAWHKRFGGKHAEILALERAKNRDDLRGAAMYVNLEPCVHFGKTPPCCPEIIKSGIKRIIIGIKDPNKLVNGKGIRMLCRNKIDVKIGCLKNDCGKLNEVFIKNVTARRPFIAVKIAMSLDGKIATKSSQSKWITSKDSRMVVKKLRDEFDAIIVGKNTVIKDNPSLSGLKKEPMRVVLDSSFEIPLKSKIFRNSRAVLITTSKAPKKKLKMLKGKGIAIKVFDEKINLASLPRWLLDRENTRNILVEGGSEIFGSFFDKRLVDRAYFFIAPKIIGGRKAKTSIGGGGIKNLKNIIQLKSVEFQKINKDFFIQGDIA